MTEASKYAGDGKKGSSDADSNLEKRSAGSSSTGAEEKGFYADKGTTPPWFAKGEVFSPIHP